MESDMVVLDQHTIEQAHPMIHSATARDRVLIQNTQAGNGFARINDPGGSTLDSINVPACESRNAAHALQEVQRGAFGNENGASRAPYLSQSCTAGNGAAIVHQNLECESRIDKPSNFLSNRHSGNDQLLLCRE